MLLTALSPGEAIKSTLIPHSISPHGGGSVTTTENKHRHKHPPWSQSRAPGVMRWNAPRTNRTERARSARPSDRDLILTWRGPKCKFKGFCKWRSWCTSCWPQRRLPQHYLPTAAVAVRTMSIISIQRMQPDFHRCVAISRSTKFLHRQHTVSLTVVESTLSAAGDTNHRNSLRGWLEHVASFLLPPHRIDKQQHHFLWVTTWHNPNLLLFSQYQRMRHDNVCCRLPFSIIAPMIQEKKCDLYWSPAYGDASHTCCTHAT